MRVVEGRVEGEGLDEVGDGGEDGDLVGRVAEAVASLAGC